MNDAIIHIEHENGRVGVIIIERGKLAKNFWFDTEKEALDYLIKYFVSEVEE